MGRPRSRAKEAPPDALAAHDLMSADALYASLLSCDRQVDQILAAESLRRSRCECLSMRHGLDVAAQRLEDERLRNGSLQSMMHSLEAQVEDARQQFDDAERKAAANASEARHLQMQIASFNDASADTAKALEDNMRLVQEISGLKPELDSLRGRLQAHDALRAEKRELQEKLLALEPELATTKRTLKGLQSSDKRRKDHSDDMSTEIQQLKDSLARAKAELVEAQDKADSAEDQLASTDGLTAELAKEKRARAKAEEAESAFRRAETAWEADRAVLDDKLNQFRTKLRTTKDSLKQAQAELKAAKETGPVSRPAAANINTKNPRKRSAAEVDADATIGTPGHVAKRLHTSSNLGDKSTFSITPFLNRTSTATARDSSADEPMQSVEDDDSPVARGSHAVLKVLSPSSSKTNARPPKLSKSGPRSSNAPPPLEQVTEEEENEEPEVTTESVAVENKASSKLQPKPKPTLKPRKSIVAFASFRDASLQPEPRTGAEPARVKKKRKLLGMSAKTLFDEDGDEGNAGPSMDANKLAAGGKRTFGGIGSLRQGSLLSKNRGPMQVANGFAFSPLKKDKRAMAK